jgi:hypothetical protein
MTSDAVRRRPAAVSECLCEPVRAWRRITQLKTYHEGDAAVLGRADGSDTAQRIPSNDGDRLPNGEDARPSPLMSSMLSGFA